ncbi:hypothetical protein NB466_00255 [Vibrio fluvialis]|uniref:hypothetical protein n=1 Tax=Vibrio TaxID=662 RepID=UPI00215C6F47|nr:MULTISPECIES: hypothetical protein [Vibrio]MCR9297304.1 hypothetical protein [Vibrio fluvialis]MCZ2802584.1 hypothetical protein [Vibrio alginolyticus]
MQGYTDIYLKGGKKDGEIINGVPLNRLPKTIAVRSECYFAIMDNESVVLCKGKLSSNWHSYSEDIYEKNENEPHKAGVIFTFVETIMIERCTAITKNKTQCLNPALYGESTCSAHMSKE